MFGVVGGGGKGANLELIFLIAGGRHGLHFQGSHALSVFFELAFQDR